MYDFDHVPSRKGTDSIKFDFAAENGLPEDVLPLWVADMDFPTAPAVTETIAEMAKHGIFGYTNAKEDYYEALKQWFSERFNWEVDASWVVRTPGVVFALAMCVRAFTREGDAVVIQQPVYYPFGEVIVKNGRRIINNPLLFDGENYRMDLSDFEEKVKKERVKMCILCSPHNPVGRVWSEEELRGLEEICLQYGVILVSDEIHSDFVWKGHTHHVLASLDKRYEENTVICTAPSKSFNLAGLQVSNIFIPNEKLRMAFMDELGRTGSSIISAAGLEACKAAYTKGGEWLDAVKNYIYENICFVKEYVEENLPEVKVIMPEGTYLIWLDLTALGLTEEERQHLIIDKAKLWLDSGAMFGKAGEGFERVNAACPRATLQEAMERLKTAVNGLKSE